jgi:hypothetical protein
VLASSTLRGWTKFHLLALDHTLPTSGHCEPRIVVTHSACAVLGRNWGLKEVRPISTFSGSPSPGSPGRTAADGSQVGKRKAKSRRGTISVLVWGQVIILLTAWWYVTYLDTDINPIEIKEYIEQIQRSGFDPRQRQRIFPLASVSRPALGPTQTPVQWVTGVLSPGVKRGRGVTLTTHPHLVPRSGMSRSG